MTDYTRLYELLKTTPASSWIDTMPQKISEAFSNINHGKFSDWKKYISEIEVKKELFPRLSSGKICFNDNDKLLSLSEKQKLTKQLMQFHPWRKGPYELSRINIDTEWRSDLKWDRLKNKISPLLGKNILDIGSGNGYHLWRMILEGANLALGIDPYMLSVMQFNLINKFSVDMPIFTAPLGVDDIPEDLNGFDTVFSMGLLYHRREPIEHIQKLHKTLCCGGELVLETLIIKSEKVEMMVPEGRYAKMRNVWNLPSVSQVELWLKECGFSKIKCIDITKTTPQEQRPTAWMAFESLPHFLDANDNSKTIEGHPAPVRAIFCAKRPL